MSEKLPTVYGFLPVVFILRGNGAYVMICACVRSIGEFS